MKEEKKRDLHDRSNTLRSEDEVRDSLSCFILGKRECHLRKKGKEGGR